jgi:hypothetical protein
MKQDQNDFLLIMQTPAEVSQDEEGGLYLAEHAMLGHDSMAIKTYSPEEKWVRRDADKYRVMAHQMIDSGEFMAAKELIDQIPFEATREFLQITLLLEMIWVGSSREARVLVDSLDNTRVAVAVMPFLKPANGTNNL